MITFFEKTVHCFAAVMMLISAIGCGSPKEKITEGPLKIILETDMGNDIDDALALAVLHKADDQGAVDLLAVGCHKLSETPAQFVDVVNTYYGHPEVEVAMSATPVKEISDYVDYTAAPCEMGFQESKDGKYHEPVKLYRKLLSEADDNSICFVSIGFGTTLAQLLDSPADEYSDLCGRDLVARKVKLLSIMAGSYGEKKRAEYNVVNDIPAMKKVFAEWPGEIIQNPFEIGKQVMFPGKLIEENLSYETLNPVAEAYKLYKEMPYDRPSWDILSVLYLLKPDKFTKSAPGTVTVDDEGYTHYTPSADGKHYILSATIDQPQALSEYMIGMSVK